MPQRTFVATRPRDVPAWMHHFASVDGSVPGAAATWDHHRTGERINLDAMPDVVDPSAFDGVGTTLADTDAVASAVVFELGGAARVDPDVLAVLRSASHWCDHLGPHPESGEAVNARGRGLHDHVARRIASASGRALGTSATG